MEGIPSSFQGQLKSSPSVTPVVNLHSFSLVPCSEHRTAAHQCSYNIFSHTAKTKETSLFESACQETIALGTIPGLCVWLRWARKL